MLFQKFKIRTRPVRKDFIGKTFSKRGEGSLKTSGVYREHGGALGVLLGDYAGFIYRKIQVLQTTTQTGNSLCAIPGWPAT